MGRLLVVVGIAVLVVFAAWRSGDRPELNEIALAERQTGASLESSLVDLGDVRVHLVQAGPVGGEPVLLLHGFPEFWYSWHPQMASLAAAGFRVAAPDLRGVNRSDKPRGGEHYGPEGLGGDVPALLDALGWERASLGGHDVGGGLVWRMVFEHPERVERAVIFNAGHPAAWAEARPRDDPESISWFRTFFRLPFLPELLIRAGDYWLLSRNLRSTSRPGTWADERLDVYKAAWARDNAIATMIGPYRADWRDLEGVPADGRPRVPVRLVWGEQDAFIPLAAGRLSASKLPEGATVFVPEASHWILQEEPELTSRVMIEFFGGKAASPASLGDPS